jgi:hypothetical protein
MPAAAPVGDRDDGFLDEGFRRRGGLEYILGAFLPTRQAS